jgi:hypothetical protein
LLDRHAAAPIVFAPLLVALSVSFARVGGETVCDLLPVAGRFTARWVCQRHRWFAPVPFSDGSGVADHGAPDLPPFMAGPVSLEPYERWLEEHGDGPAEILADYHHLLSHAATGAYGHEVLVTVTVDQPSGPWKTCAPPTPWWRCGRRRCS